MKDDENLPEDPEDDRQIPVEVPLGAIYHVGMALSVQAVKNKNLGESADVEDEMLLMLHKVMPTDLFEVGPEEYAGDLNQGVSLPLTYRGIRVAGSASLALSTGRQIIEALPLDPNDRAYLEGMRTKVLRAFLTVQSLFEHGGGKRDPALKLQVEGALG